MSHTEAIRCLPRIVIYMWLGRKNGGTKEYNDAAVAAVAVGEKAHLGTKGF